MDIYHINALINIVLAGLVLYSSILVYRCGMLPRWLLLSFWFVCTGWIVLYIIVLSNNPLGIDSTMFGRIFIRPLVTLTLSTVAATFIYRARRCPKI